MVPVTKVMRTPTVISERRTTVSARRVLEWIGNLNELKPSPCGFDKSLKIVNVRSRGFASELPTSVQLVKHEIERPKPRGTRRPVGAKRTVVLPESDFC